jgi:lipoate-protein ligase A
VGAFLAARLVKVDVEELYDYDVLRQLTSPTMLIVRTSEPTFVLGGSQSLDVLDEHRRQRVALRRRRGGGGVVLLQPDDVWIDWWLPADDARWSSDVHVTSNRVGEWWRHVLATRLESEVLVHQGTLEGDRAWRVACFAGRGPGEIFVEERKAVGVTQWRVREGVFVSSVLHAHSSAALLDLLVTVPDGLANALRHHTLKTLGLDGDAVTAALMELSHPVDVRQLFLIA